MKYIKPLSMVAYLCLIMAFTSTSAHAASFNLMDYIKQNVSDIKNSIGIDTQDSGTKRPDPNDKFGGIVMESGTKRPDPVQRSGTKRPDPD